MYDVLCAGMALIDSIIRGFNQKNNTAISGSLHVGGEAVNASIAAAKLGLKTGIVCALGDDAADKFSDFLKKILPNELQAQITKAEADGNVQMPELLAEALKDQEVINNK